jgi:hypothetical protein
VVADDRSGQSPGVSSLAAASRIDAGTQSASFDVGSVRLELSASPGAARLVLAADGSRDTYVIDPSALTAWSSATTKLLSLAPAADPEHRAEFRAPYLIDREGRTSIAFEGLVTELGVGYRLLVSRPSGVVTGIMTTAEVARSVAEAAAGAAAVARGTA